MDSKWDRRYWDLAELVSTWSKDPNAQVGAIITSARGGVNAIGYNGFPAGVEDDERLSDSQVKNEMVVHAEQNAVLIAGEAARGATIYVAGKPVCSRCAGVIIQAGIRRVVAMDPEKSDEESKWRSVGVLAMNMLREASLTVDFMESPPKKQE